MSKTRIAIGIGFLFSFFFALPTEAVTKCSFTRDLELGVEGEDVRCLQRFLNDTGYKITLSGVGSPGSETTQFKDLTKKALQAWQAANGVPSTGYFGPASRQKYNSVSGGVSVVPSQNNAAMAEELKNKIAQIQAQLEKAKADQDKPSSVSNSNSGSSDYSNNESGARSAIKDALTMIGKADDEMDGPETSGAPGQDFEDARDDLFDAIGSFFSGNYPAAIKSAIKAHDNAEDAFEKAGGKSEKDEIEDLIDNVDSQINSAWDQVEAADNNGEDVEEAENILEQAEDRLAEAEDALDDKDYDKAENLADEAEDLVDDAIDAIGEESDDKEDARDAIEDAKDDIADAKDEIEEADDDGDDVDEAEDLINEAEDKLDDAEDAFDDGDYDDALELAEDASSLADEAVDSL